MQSIKIPQIIANPSLVTQYIHLKTSVGSEEVLFRPLFRHDISPLYQFLESLSDSTRRFATYPSYDLHCAQKFCDEINHYDLFRMVAVNEREQIIALFEFNFNLSEFDIKRYRKYGIELNQETDIQFAPCIRDEYQNQNFGSELLLMMINLAKQMGKTRMIAWAGVLIDNNRAIRFYEKNNFQIFREKYVAEDGYECYDAILEMN